MNDVKRQYSVSNHLQTRIHTHKRFEEKQVNLDEVVLEHLQLQRKRKHIRSWVREWKIPFPFTN